MIIYKDQVYRPYPGISMLAAQHDDDDDDDDTDPVQILYPDQNQHHPSEYCNFISIFILIFNQLSLE